MGWGKSSTPAAAPSKLSTLIPLVIFLLLVSGIAWVVYQVMVASRKIGMQASQRMSKKNVVLTKDGVRVGVRHVDNEKYVDKTQKWVVKAWDMHSPKQNGKTK